MSIATIKNTLESYLVANVSDVAIKRNNTTYYTLAGVKLTQAQIDDLDIFLEPKIIPISEDRIIYSTGTPFDYRVFFQVDIYIKEATGMGDIYTIANSLNGLFKEHIESGIVCENTRLMNNFKVDSWIVSPYRVTASLMDS